MVRSGNHPIERVNHGHKENEEPAMPQILPARNADAPRRSLPMGISESMSDDNQRLLEELHTRQDALAQGASDERLEVWHHRKDGEPVWVPRSGEPVHGPEGQSSRYIEVLTDIT